MSSPSRLLQNQLVQRQIGNRLAQPLVLDLQVLHPPNLIRLQPAELLAPTVVRHLGHTEGADHIADALALRDQHVRLPQLGDHILRLVPLRSHLSVLVPARRPYLRADHFDGGGSDRGVEAGAVQACERPRAGGCGHSQFSRC